MSYSMAMKLKEKNYKSILERINHYVRRKSNFDDTLPTKDALFALEMSYGAAINDIIDRISKLEWNNSNEAYGFNNKFHIIINADTTHPELYINNEIQAEYITVEGAKEAALAYNTDKIREELDIVANENG